MKILLNPAARWLRVAVAKQYVKRRYSRSMTAVEREWVKDGWMPATLKMEVRER